MFAISLRTQFLIVSAAVVCQSLILTPSDEDGDGVARSSLDLQPCRCKLGGCDASSPLSKWPKIHLIYGLWDDGDLPSSHESVMKEWKDLNPGWEVKLWNRPLVDAFVQKHFSGWGQAFASSPPILQSDIFRYMVVLKEGGLYVDFDVPPVALQSALGCSGSRDNLTDVFFQETVIDGALEDKPIREGHPEYNHRIANYAFFAEPGSKALERTLRLVRHRVDKHMSSWGNQSAVVAHSRETPVSATGLYGTLQAWFSHAADFIFGTTMNVRSTEKKHLKRLKVEMWDPYTPIFITGPDAITEAIHGVRFKSFLKENPWDVSGLKARVCSDKIIYNRNAGTWNHNRNALLPRTNFVKKSQEAWCAKS